MFDFYSVREDKNEKFVGDNGRACHSAASDMTLSVIFEIVVGDTSTP